MSTFNFKRYQDIYKSNPQAFIEGAHSFCKYAAPKKESRTLWETIRPWVIGLGIAYLGAKGGEIWGRYANKHGYRQGPVLGPFAALVDRTLPPGYEVAKNPPANTSTTGSTDSNM